MTNLWIVTPISSQAAGAFILALLGILFLPGLLVSLLLFDRGRMGWLLRLPVSVALSISFDIIFATFVLITNGPLVVLFWMVNGFCLVIALLFLARRRQRSTSALEPDPASQAPSKINGLLLGVFIALTVFAVVLFSRPVDRFAPGNDTWVYLSLIRKWATLGQRPTVDVKIGTEQTGFRRFFGGWQLVQSLICVVSGVDPIDEYGLWLPSLLMFDAYLAFYCLAETLFRSRNAAVLSALIQVLALGVYTNTREDLGRLFFLRINEDKFLLTFVLLPVTTIFMLRYLRSNRKSDLACLIPMSLALPLTHPLGLVEVGLTFGLFALLHLLFDRRRETIRRFVLIFLPLAFLLVIPLLQRRIVTATYSVDTPEAMSSYKGLLTSRLLVLDAERNVYIVHPELLQSPLIALALMLTPLLLFCVKSELGAQFLFANMFGVYLWLFNPLLSPLLGRVTTPGLLWRLTCLLPASMTIGFLLEKGMASVQPVLARRNKRGSLLVALLPLSLILAGAVFLRGRDMLHWPETLRGPVHPAETDLLLQARNFACEPSVIMCRDPIARLLPAFLEYGFVPIYRDQGILETAKQDVKAFYSAKVINDAIWDILQRYNCRYLIADREQVSVLFWVSPLLSPLYVNERYVLYEVAPASSDNPLILGNTYYEGGEWDAAAEVYEQAKAQDWLVASLRLFEIRSKQGRKAEAERILAELTSFQPDNRWTQLSLADFYRRQGEAEAALKHYQKALELAASDTSIYASNVTVLAQLGLSLLTIVPAAEHQRWGLGVNQDYGLVTDYDFESLRIGWYTDWGVREGASPIKAEHVQIVMVRKSLYPPPWDRLEKVLLERPEEIWLIGAWPEWQEGGNRTPEEYAEIYHTMYRFIKERDPDARVAPGGIVSPTPLRLQWLDAVLKAYQARYGSKMPADAWHIWNYILREEAGSWGIGIPAGLDAKTGQLYEPADNANLAVFREHVVAFRQWMADRDERYKPLIISGYGVQMPSEYLGDGDAKRGEDRISAYMTRTFDYLRTARDDKIGYPGDENRLVQRWLWYSLNEKPYDPHTGSGGNGMLFTRQHIKSTPELTAFGKAFVAYMASLD